MDSKLITQIKAVWTDLYRKAYCSLAVPRPSLSLISIEYLIPFGVNLEKEGRFKRWIIRT